MRILIYSLYLYYEKNTIDNNRPNRNNPILWTDD